MPKKLQQNSVDYEINGRIVQERDTIKQKKMRDNEDAFVRYYTADLEQDKLLAYKKAVNNLDMTEHSARVGASRYLSRPRVKQQIAEIKAARLDKNAVKKELMTDIELIRDYVFTATCDIADYYYECGQRVKQLAELTVEQRRNIKSIRWGSGKKPKIMGYVLLDREKARDSLAQMMGLKAQDFDFKQLLRVLVQQAGGQLPDESAKQVSVRVINHEQQSDFEQLLAKIDEIEANDND